MTGHALQNHTSIPLSPIQLYLLILNPTATVTHTKSLKENHQGTSKDWLR